jgi:RNA polymerase sigma-70 factor (ECF subfamily)
MDAHAEGSGASLEAIERLYRARLAEFRRVAAAIIGDRDLARDAVQDAFASAVRGRHGFRGTGPLDGWLWRAVVNASLTRLRALRPPMPPAPEPSPGDEGDESERDRVRGALALLPERQRLVLFLHYFAELDYLTIASALGISSGTVGATLHSARATMRQLLEGVPR